MIKSKVFSSAAQSKVRLLVLVFASVLLAKTAHAPAALLPATTLQFSATVHNAFTLPYPDKAAIETKVGGDGYQFAIVTFVDRDLFLIDTISHDDFKGGTISVLGALDERKLLLLVPAGINVLDLKLKMVTDEYATISPRADLEPQYFQAMLTGTEPPTVIAEIQPSIDPDGTVDPVQHSLIFDDVLRKKTMNRIPLVHPLKELPPVFFNPHFIIYRNKRMDISEPWKSLDNSLSPIRHPLCGILDTAFKESAIFGIALSDQYQSALVYFVDKQTSHPGLAFVSWHDGKVFPMVLPGGFLMGQRNLSASPSGGWAFFTALFDNSGKRTMTHFAIELDPAAKPVPRILAAAAKNDCFAWINGGESLALFTEGKITMWNLPHSAPKVVSRKDPKKKSSRQKRL